MSETTLAYLAEKTASGNDLDESEIRVAANQLTAADASVEDKESFLVSFADKGESAQEIAAFASCFREFAIDPMVDDLAHSAIDVCGTGGDKSGSFNVSTTVAFILAAAGVTVFKHGNRSITSKCGSADLLEAVGIPLEAKPALIRSSLEELHFAFFFAPVYHPAFKEIVPVRKSLAEKGHRTVFNILGPLINPGRPAYQLLGVFSPDFVSRLASCLEALDLRRALVAHCSLSGAGGLDELSCCGKNLVSGVGGLSETKGDWTPEDFGLPCHPYTDIAGGNVQENLRLLDTLFSGEAPSGLMDSVCLNAGTALWIAERTTEVKQGVAMAKDLLLGGQVKSWLERAKAFYADASET
ncbi:MAG: anthranilate phosphoribosyltransferase [Opitutae bacterium]|nr:anthranilate phosphoribosyltransferase [Opitutae bacterium]|tara:strand:+ start:3883 stop:4947 length:1065 start_codon:yes stop_codon:yes gene_type:complete